MNPLQSAAEYERFVYTLQELFPDLSRSTLTVIRRGSTVATLTGELDVDKYRVVVREKLSFATEPGRIVSYGYEVWQGSQKLFWYDSQPHPEDPDLACTIPHHKHVGPDIKHNRVPAYGFSFTEPNLPVMIQEVLQLLERESHSD
jgi:hypothetical protein